MRTACFLLALGLGAARGGSDGLSPDEAHRTVFFAVLEGLYLDGASNEDVDRILAGGDTPELFVYGCPICMPALDAFRVYRGRARLSTRKDGDTFGPGLPEELRARLAGEAFSTRWEALRDLLRRYVARRLDTLRLTRAEREAYAAVLEEMRKKGMAVLQSYEAAGRAGALGELDRCALCDGANAGCPER